MTLCVDTMGANRTGKEPMSVTPAHATVSRTTPRAIRSSISAGG